MPDFATTFLISLLTLTAPLLLAAMGGLLSERAGVMNIGLEGLMLAAACSTWLVSSLSGSPYLGLAAGLAVATLLSLLHGYLTQAFQIDHIISGMGINFLALGATSLVSRQMGEEMKAAPLFSVALYWVVAAAIVIQLGLLLRRTKFGLRLSAVGNSPGKARLMGVEPLTIRYQAMALTGICCGFAGAVIVSNAGWFVDDMIAGRGYIALAALILGGWRPIPTLLACLLFGTLYALSLALYGTVEIIPRAVWTILPYLVTLIALAGFLGRNRAPAGLGEP